MFKKFLVISAFTLLSACQTTVTEVYAESSVSQSGQLEPHKKSKYVDYSPQHEFTYEKGQFLVDGMPSYRKQWIQMYGYPEYDRAFSMDMKEIWYPHKGIMSVNCFKKFNTPDLLEYVGHAQTHGDKFANDIAEQNHIERGKNRYCSEKLKHLVHEDVIRNDKNGHAITYFFDDLMPSFLENDSWLGLPNRREPGEDFIPEQQAIEHILYTYIYFSDWYDTSDELDEKFVSYFRKYERTRHKHIKNSKNSNFITKCPDDIYRMRPNWNSRVTDKHLDFLACKQEFWPMLYSYMAVRFQDNDILNEALFFFKHNAKYTFEEGATIEVTRGFRGPGYAIMASEFFAQGAWVIEQFTNTDVLSINGEGLYNNTVYDMIMSGIEAFQYPERYFKYAELGQDTYGGDYRKPDLPDNPHGHYHVVGSILDASKSDKWDEYLNGVGDPNWIMVLAIDPLLMSRAYGFVPSVGVE